MKNLNEHDALTQAYFDKWAAWFEQAGFAFKYFQKRVISLSGLRQGSVFLDLGCGTGWAVRYAERLLQGRGRFIGIDISAKMIEKAKELAAGSEKIVFHHANAENLPLKSNSVDTCICTFSFHHYLHPGKVLSEVRRVLKPNGRFYILDGTPDDPLIRLVDRAAAKLEKSHVRQYSTSEFRHMFQKAGLQYVKSKVILFYPIKVHIAGK